MATMTMKMNLPLGDNHDDDDDNLLPLTFRIITETAVDMVVVIREGIPIIHNLPNNPNTPPFPLLLRPLNSLPPKCSPVIKISSNVEQHVVYSIYYNVL